MQLMLIVNIWKWCRICEGSLYPVSVLTASVPGVPVRIEVGARELKNGVGFLKRRDNNAKSTVPVADLAAHVPKLLEQIQVTKYVCDSIT